MKPSLGEKALQTALELPLYERAKLIEKILESFDDIESRLNESLWADEAEDRLDWYKKGEIQALTAEQVFNSLNV